MVSRFSVALLIGVSYGAQAVLAPPSPTVSPPLKVYRDVAHRHDGDAVRGREVVFSEEKGSCARCHSVDGSAVKAGPDLFGAGDKFPRREVINAILEPSANIAVGYGVTLIETKSGEEYVGILRQI